MLQSLTTVSRSNLAALTAHLVANKSLSLAVLRVNKTMRSITLLLCS